MKTRTFIFCFFLVFFLQLRAEENISKYNPVWTTPSANSSGSMPCGGHDIGLNVWVENGDLLFYLQQSGAFDENNTSLKAGRVRVQFCPTPFNGEVFKQELQLENGSVHITGQNNGLKAEVSIWVDVFHPVVHVEIESNQSIEAKATYESWRYQDRDLRQMESFQNSYKWAPPVGLQTKKDEIAFDGNIVQFYHRNKGKTVFDVTVAQQKLDSVKGRLFNPLENLTSGGCMYGNGFVPNGETSGTYLDTDFKGWQLKSARPAKKQELKIALQTQNANLSADWVNSLKQLVQTTSKTTEQDKKATAQWWAGYWDRSFIDIETKAGDTSRAAQVARNYQLFRYMLGCNAYGSYPTKFNGGLFTVDPVFTKGDRAFTPDFRNWGGGTFTAQNQRLVYFPMLKSGDFDMMEPQLDFYLNILKNAELRSLAYWGHKGACFTEQIENFGLPNPSEYGWKRPDGYDPGMEYNAWLEYEWDTALEFCWMALQLQKYTGQNISRYIPMVESCLAFFDEHYQYLARNRGCKTSDADGHLVLYPGSGCETYKMATNSASTVAALTQVTKGLLALPESYLNPEKREYWRGFLKRIPPIPFREIDGHATIAPAKMWERINNVEVPQLYPVFPWGIYGVGKPDLDIALNTWKYDPDAVKFRSATGWKQDAIWAAELGLTDEAATFVQQKLGNSGQRFPAFWGPGFDWTPDHNWGGSGMIALQEMLLQTNGDSILLFPAWPAGWDVHFKLNAPKNTVVEAMVKEGKVVMLNVSPEERKKDIQILLNDRE